MDKSNEIVDLLTDKFKTSISTMDKSVLTDYQGSLKVAHKTEQDTFNRVMFLYALKDLTKVKYDELMGSSELIESKLVFYDKPKLDNKTQEIVKVPYVHYDLYQDDMKLSDMIRQKGFLVSENVSAKDTNEDLILAINRQNQQINSIVDGCEAINPIRNDFKDVLKNQKDRSISDRYEHLSKIDHNIALLKYKLEFVRIELSKRTHADKDKILERLQTLKDKYDFKPTVAKSTTTQDGVKIVNGVEHHTHEGIKGYHKTTTEHKDKQLHEFK